VIRNKKPEPHPKCNQPNKAHVLPCGEDSKTLVVCDSNFEVASASLVDVLNRDIEKAGLMVGAADDGVA
jgi:hypothetical protein